ncbi:transcriptional regulator [Actinorhabdospora filicis]|uniref:Transcriptional regulator n=1 Tax=Actinorhabdospora filicis TaxID=1785913 RepID=A0A9W6SQF6_9ACTN|nr:helix-turn-helix domain-containing protein [Actinorhabdospora filicis]GLZ81070.1 transcriptional regulator [Actinorhabdospora filicis]
MAHDRDGTLGLAADEERAYRALMDLARTDTAGLAAALDMSAPDAAAVLAALTARGLARMHGDDQYSAAPPDTALGAVLADRFEALRDGYDALHALVQAYRDAQRRRGGDEAETITGAAALRSRIDQMQRRATTQMRTFIRGPRVTARSDLAVHDEGLARGVRYRQIYEKTMLDLPGQVDRIRDLTSRGEEVRFAASVPLKIVIADDFGAIIGEPGAQPVALATEHPALVLLAASLFEQVWTDAVPAPQSHPDAPFSSEEDRMLLSLLLAGLTDQTIATRLGVGLRTVQRRVRDLMDTAGVDTRIQLGWQAARRGWV